MSRKEYEIEVTVKAVIYVEADSKEEANRIARVRASNMDFPYGIDVVAGIEFLNCAALDD